ncbi:MAG: hypothetical protein ACE5R6_19005 [Candidatus Heimdallarchaeota archaeon]
MSDIFLAYDVRGKYPENINEDVATRIGKALGTLVEQGTVCIGNDIRISSPRLHKSAIAGLEATGADVSTIGTATTAVCYFQTWARKMDAGVFVTASHNPPAYNGFKFMEQDGTAFLEKLEHLKQIYLSGKFVHGYGQVQELPEAISEYCNFITSQVEIDRKLKIITDSFFAAGSLVIEDLLSSYDVDAYNLSCEAKADFGGRIPEPTEARLRAVMTAIRKQNADFGVGFDGDADRSVFVDDKGRIVDGSIMTLLFAQDYLEHNKGARIVAPINSTSLLQTEVERLGGELIWTRIGHSFIEKELVRKNAIFAGEPSSHFYFNDLYPFSDGILATIKLAALLSRSSQSLSELIDVLPPTFLLNSALEFESHRQKGEKMRATIESIQNLYEDILTIDGVKVNLNRTAWVLIRPSNTEPKIRISIEAESEKTAKHILEEFTNIVHRS